MSKFNPTAWLNRSRVFSESSRSRSSIDNNNNDISQNDSSLAGMNYLSQSSIGSNHELSPKDRKSFPAATAAAMAINNNNSATAESPSAKVIRQWRQLQPQQQQDGLEADNVPRVSSTTTTPTKEAVVGANNGNGTGGTGSSTKQHMRHQSMPIVYNSSLGTFGDCHAHPQPHHPSNNNSNNNNYHQYSQRRQYASSPYRRYHQRYESSNTLETLTSLLDDPQPNIQEHHTYYHHNEQQQQRGGREDEEDPHDGTCRPTSHAGMDRLNRNPSFGDASCISGLSADETYYSAKSSRKRSGTSKAKLNANTNATRGERRGVIQGLEDGGLSESRHDHPLLIPSSKLVDAAPVISEEEEGDDRGGDGDRIGLSSHENAVHVVPKGRDFSRAFDHLMLTNNEEEEYEIYDEATNNCYRVKRITPRASNHSSSKTFTTPTTSSSTTTGFSRTKNSNSNYKRTYYNKNIQKPNHQRVQSDTMAFRPSTAGSNGTNSGASSYYKTAPTSTFSKSKNLPAHATLRERMSTPSSSGISKPQLLQVRSTSNTVQSLSSSSSNNNHYYNDGSGGHVSGSGGNGGGMVWNGQPMINGLLTVPASGSGSSTNYVHADAIGEGVSSSSSSYHKHHVLLGTRQRRGYYPSPNSNLTSGKTPNDSNNNHNHNSNDDKSTSLQDVPEDDPSTKWTDSKSMDGKSVLSGKSGTSAVTIGQRKRVVKDEIKFIMTRFVPPRLRKGKNKKVNLERSEGCLA